MKFGLLKIGKSNENKGTDKDASGGGTAIQIAELEEQLSDRTKSLKQTEAKLKKLSGKGKNGKNIDDILAVPHGPIGELTVEPEAELPDLISIPEEETDTLPEENGEGIKLVEVKIKPGSPPIAEKVVKAEPVSPPMAAKAVKAEPVPPPAAAKDTKEDLSRDSLNALFSSDEEEENPLASLVRSLPDVDASELMDDIKEIKGIIEDWQKK
jgi:hypothetical protein